MSIISENEEEKENKNNKRKKISELVYYQLIHLMKKIIIMKDLL